MLRFQLCEYSLLDLRLFVDLSPTSVPLITIFSWNIYHLLFMKQ